MGTKLGGAFTGVWRHGRQPLDNTSICIHQDTSGCLGTVYYFQICPSIHINPVVVYANGQIYPCTAPRMALHRKSVTCAFTLRRGQQISYHLHTMNSILPSKHGNVQQVGTLLDTQTQGPAKNIKQLSACLPPSKPVTCRSPMASYGCACSTPKAIATAAPSQ